MIEFHGRIYPGRNPAGTYSFNGSVPMELAYRFKDGRGPIDDATAANIKRFGAGGMSDVGCMVFPTLEDAMQAAEALGYVRGDDPEHAGMRKVEG